MPFTKRKSVLHKAELRKGNPVLTGFSAELAALRATVEMIPSIQ
jgi:hypothetical protein